MTASESTGGIVRRRPLNIGRMNKDHHMHIVEAGMELFSLTPGKHKLGKLIFDQLNYEGERGANVRYYLPETKDMVATYKVASEETITVGGKKFTVSHVIVPGINDNVSIYVIKNKEVFGSRDLYENDTESIQPYVLFPEVVMGHLRKTEFKPDIVSCHEWQAGLMPTYLKVQKSINTTDNFFNNVHTVFTSHDHHNLGLFPSKDWRLTGLPEELFTYETFEYFKRVCLLKAGMHADLTFFDSDEVIDKAISSSEPAGIGDFIKGVKESGRLKGILARETDIFSPEMPDDYGRERMETFRELAEGNEYSLALTEVIKKEMEEGNFPIDTVNMNIKKWQDGNGKIIEEQLKKLKHPVINSAKVFKIIEEELNTRLGSGSAVDGVLLENFKNNLLNEFSRSLTIVNAGLFTRGFGVSLAEGCDKAQLQLFAKKIIEVILDMAISIFAQSPNSGYFNWIFGSDNIVSSRRIYVGRRPLNEAKQGIIMLAVPQEIDMDVNSPEMRKLEALGILTVEDEDLGNLDKCLEKPKAEDILKKAKGKFVYKNSFIFGIRHDIQVMMAERYRRYEEENIPLDFVHHKIEPMTYDFATWVTPVEEGGRYGANAADKKMSRKDYEMLWHIAKAIKIKSGGVGVGSFGKDCWWQDVGMPGEVHKLQYTAVSTADMKSNHLVRRMFDIISDAVNSYMRNVKTPEGDNSYYVENTVFKNGGILGKNSVVGNTIFEQWTDVPEQAVIMNGKILNHCSIGEGTLLYNFESNSDVSIPPRSVAATIHTRGGKVNCQHPIEFDKKTFKDAKEIDGNKVFEGEFTFNELQGLIPLYRIPANELEKVKQLLIQIDGKNFRFKPDIAENNIDKLHVKDETKQYLKNALNNMFSLRNTLGYEEKLKEDIDRLLRELEAGRKS